jgi:putative ABC transport system ATP-binding protein
MNTTTTAAVRARELRKDLGEGPTRIEVLRGVDFDALPGQLTFLVGPSGCGKTTLISVIAGLLDSSGGEVRLFDQNIERFSATERILFRRKNLGFVYQQYNLLPALPQRKTRPCRYSPPEFADERRSTLPSRCS